VHKVASRRSQPARRPRKPARTPLSATHAARSAVLADADDIQRLIAAFVDDGLMLPRSVEDVEAAIDDFVVVVDRHDRVQACAALHSYCPSLAEVASVAVDRGAQGMGLGTLAVRSVEAMARQREISELFALSLAEAFFESLGYEPVPLDRFPEKVARYEELAQRGVTVTPKTCFRKALTN
jgi:amino-acid N-acetyltransferase